ncbi:MAG: DUF4434 domain-containing protein, partial [Deefgea sp.]
MKLIRCIFSLLLLPSLAIGAPDCAPAKEKIIIYQPWSAHEKLTKPQLSSISKTLNQSGFTHLLLQWNRYGEHSFTNKDTSYWIHSVSDRKNRIIEGLYADPDYFKALNLPDAELASYLTKLRQNSLDEASLLSLRATHRIRGWYLPEEIDDLNWTSAARQKMLSHHFKLLVDALHKLHPGVPVYASTFFGGN